MRSDFDTKGACGRLRRRVAARPRQRARRAEQGGICGAVRATAVPGQALPIEGASHCLVVNLARAPSVRQRRRCRCSGGAKPRPIQAAGSWSARASAAWPGACTTAQDTATARGSTSCCCRGRSLPTAMPRSAGSRPCAAPSRLKHPNLADARRDRRVRALALRAVRRGGLHHAGRAHARRQGDRLPTRLARMLVAALQGLAFAHEGGVAHRDLQPYMVLLGEPGMVRLMGLEVALHAEREQHDAPAARPRASHQHRGPGAACAARRGACRRAVRRPAAAPGLVRAARAGRGRRRSRWPSACRRSGRDLVRLPWDIAAARARGAARHRQPRHRPTGAPALPQRARPDARARRLVAGRGRRGRRAAGLADRSAAQRRLVAGICPAALRAPRAWR